MFEILQLLSNDYFLSVAYIRLQQTLCSVRPDRASELRTSYNADPQISARGLDDLSDKGTVLDCDMAYNPMSTVHYSNTVDLWSHILIQTHVLMFNLAIQRIARFREDLVDMETTNISSKQHRFRVVLKSVSVEPNQTYPYAVRKDARSTKICSAFFIHSKYIKSMN